MTKSVTPHRWFSAWRPVATPLDSDAADLGTAFGLDMSLNEIHHEPLPAAPVARRPIGWVHRLANRRKPAG